MSGNSETPRKKRRRDGQKKLDNLLGKSEKKKGLNPVDLLYSLPANQRKMINWLARRKVATLEELQNALSQENDNIIETLNALRDDGYVLEVFRDNKLAYRVVFGADEEKSGRNLSEDIWSRIDLNKIGFLRQLPLFQQLQEADLKEVAEMMELRRLTRDDVIIWQGQTSDKVYFIKSGVVGITHISADMQDAQLLAHLKQGDILGEYGLLVGQNFTAASATATALSAVELLVISHEEFRRIIDNHKSVLLGMARMLVERLLDMNPKRSQTGTRLSLVFSVGPRVGRTLLGNALAMMLGRDQTAVYTEYPTAHHLISEFKLGIDENREYFKHPTGFDIAIPSVMPSLPAGLRTALIFEQLSEKYANIVIGLPGRVDNAITYLLERADQIIMISSPDAISLEALNSLRNKLKNYIHPEKSTLFHIINRHQSHHKTLPLPAAADFEIPFIDENISLDIKQAAELPAPLLAVGTTLADRLGRTNQISVYIPTTMSVDQVTDTSEYVQKTLEVLGQMFGGATSSQARGVWNSNDVGLVGETVYIVRSYANKSDLDKHLPQVLSFVEQLKYDLEQEAMAVEVNQKLMLI